MATTFAFTCLGKVGGKIGEYLLAPFGRHFTYMFCFNTNFKELETQLEKLKSTRSDVQKGVDDDRRKVRTVGDMVLAWQTDANEVISEVEGIIQDKPKVKEGCLNGWCPNLKLRYSLSRKAVKKTKAAVDLRADGVHYTRSSYSLLPASMQTIPSRDFTGFESRRLNMEEIIKALTNDEINLIGICGLPGVGKTTMAQEAAKRAKEEKLFAEVAFVAVGQNLNVTNIQNCIADHFGLTDLGEHVDRITRANLLRERLLQDNKRILLILDDIWEEFDLQDMGFPSGGSNKTFKFLYTSRSRDLWHDVPTRKEIPLGLLSVEEAWLLFRDKAGVLVDEPELKPIAKQIVSECGRLPLVLVIIGSTLCKKSRGNFIKDIWEDMLDRLKNSNTPVDKGLSSRLELSYNYVDDEEAKRLFLLCCLFEEDKAIRIEDLARYAMGLLLFDGINEMGKVRRRVFALVEDLKSRYLLLESKNQYGKYVREFVKVHDIVRDMGISIASKGKVALVSHGVVSEWPKDTYEHSTWISVMSSKIIMLPQGLTCPNLEFLMLDCWKIKKLPCNFFERMEKLKVLRFNNFVGIPTFQSLSNLRTLSFEHYCQPVIDNVSGFRGLCNLEILNFHGSSIKELPKEIGELVNLRLLDLGNTRKLNRIRPGVISRLVHLEEIYTMGSNFGGWEGEGANGGRNANLREFESLSNLNTLEISISSGAVIPRLSIFSKLKKYRVVICYINRYGHTPIGLYGWYNLALPSYDKCKKLFSISRWTPIPLDHGGFDLLSRSSDFLSLEKPRNNDMVRVSLIEGLHQLKRLHISYCDTLEYLANPVNQVQQLEGPTAIATVVFPILEKLNLNELPNLREICRNPVSKGSFGKLSEIVIRNCGLLNLFELQNVGCLCQLKKLSLSSCRMMKEVIWKEHQEDVNVATKRIEFPKLTMLELCSLMILVGFYRGIEEIDFPQLKSLDVEYLSQFNRLFGNNSNLSFNSEPNDNVGFLSVFSQKVTFPSLENLRLFQLQNVSDIWGGELTAFSYSKLKQLHVRDCGSLRTLFNPSTARLLVNLQELRINNCRKMEAVVDWEEEVEEGQERTIDETLFPQLRSLYLLLLPNLRRFCRFTQRVIFPSLEILELLELQNVSELTAFSFSKLKQLDACSCGSLKTLFNPSMARLLVNLQKLKITHCKKMEAVVDWEEEVEEGQGRTIDKTLFPQLRHLKLECLQSLRRFCHFTYPLEMPQLSKMKMSRCPNMDAFSSGHVSAPNLSLPGISWNGDLNNAIKLLQENKKVIKYVDPKSWITEEIFEKLKTWKLTEIINPSQCRSLKLPGHLRVSTKISRLMYTNSGDGILALAANAIHLFWRWRQLHRDLSCSATTTVPPQLWQPSSDILMTNEFTATNPEDAVSCFALSDDGIDVMSTSGGRISLFNMWTFETMRTFMPLPPAATFLAFHPEDNNIIAIGMDDSTIQIYNVGVNEVKSKLKGHSKRITGLAFSRKLSLLVSSGADAQLCLWNSDTWEKQKTTFLQIPSGRTPTTQLDTHVQFHPDDTHFLVVHETQLLIYEATKLECVGQWIQREPTPITHAMFSCDGELVYASFLDGSVYVFITFILWIRCRIYPSAYLSPSISNSNVQALVIAAHPQISNQFAIGLSDGGVHVLEPLEFGRKWGVLPPSGRENSEFA